MLCLTGVFISIYHNIAVLWLPTKQAHGIKAPPHTGFYVETEDATHAPREYEKVYYSQNETFLGERGRHQSQSGMGKQRDR